MESCTSRRRCLPHGDQTLEGKTCLVSGSGKVAQSTMEKLIELGARVVTFSDTGGSIHDPDGVDREKLDWLKELKNLRRGSVRELRSTIRALSSPRRRRETWTKTPSGTTRRIVLFPVHIKTRSAFETRGIFYKAAFNLVCGRGEHAHHTGGDEVVPQPPDPLCSRESRQCGWRGGLGSRDGPKQHAFFLDARGSRSAAPDHHEEHPQSLPGCGGGVRHSGKLRQWSEHRRLRQSSRRHDRPRRLTKPSVISQNRIGSPPIRDYRGYVRASANSFGPGSGAATITEGFDEKRQETGRRRHERP